MSEWTLTLTLESVDGCCGNGGGKQRRCPSKAGGLRRRPMRGESLLKSRSTQDETKVVVRCRLPQKYLGRIENEDIIIRPVEPASTADQELTDAETTEEPLAAEGIEIIPPVVVDIDDPGMKDSKR